MARKLIILGVILLIVGLLLAYIFQKPPKQKRIEENPSNFILKEEEIYKSINITRKHPISISQFSKKINKSIDNLKTWNYKTGFLARYEDEDRVFNVIIAKFSTIKGADSTFDFTVNSLSQRIRETLITKVGREIRAFKIQENIYNVMFRESNLIVLIEGEILANEVEMYSEMIEEKIHRVLKKQ